jgi:hypothetical protein
MFVILSLVVFAVAPVLLVIAALIRAPEAYENEHGLQIVHKRSRQVKRVALAKRFSRSSYFNFGAYGARTRNLRRDRAAL